MAKVRYLGEPVMENYEIPNDNARRLARLKQRTIGELSHEEWRDYNWLMNHGPFNPRIEQRILRDSEGKVLRKFPTHKPGHPQAGQMKPTLVFNRFMAYPPDYIFEADDKTADYLCKRTFQGAQIFEKVPDKSADQIEALIRQNQMLRDELLTQAAPEAEEPGEERPIKPYKPRARQ